MSKHEFLNSDFEEPGRDQEYCKAHKASLLAYRVHALIETARYAAENDTCGQPLDRRGIAQTLEVAALMCCDLIDAAEQVEKDAKNSKAT